MCSGSEAGSYLRLIDFVYHSTLGLRVTKKRRRASCVHDTGKVDVRLPGKPRKVDVRLPGKGNLNSHGARPVHLIITMIKRIRTSRLSKKKSLSGRLVAVEERRECREHPACTTPLLQGYLAHMKHFPRRTLQ